MMTVQTVGGYRSQPLKIFAIRRVKVYLREQCILYLNHPSKRLNSGFTQIPHPSLLKFSKSNCQTHFEMISAEAAAPQDPYDSTAETPLLKLH